MLANILVIKTSETKLFLKLLTVNEKVQTKGDSEAAFIAKMN